MKIRATQQSDVVVAGKRRALFEGQVYDLPSVQASSLIIEGKAEPATPFREVESKAVEEFENKAVMMPPSTKRRGRASQ